MFDWIDKSTNLRDDVQWNQQNNEWGWWSMKASAAKVCNESNYTKIAIIKWEIMKILVSKIHIFLMKIEKSKI